MSQMVLHIRTQMGLLDRVAVYKVNLKDFLPPPSFFTSLSADHQSRPRHTPRNKRRVAFRLALFSTMRYLLFFIRRTFCFTHEVLWYHGLYKLPNDVLAQVYATCRSGSVTATATCVEYMKIPDLRALFEEAKMPEEVRR